jgi:hypothetical protein
MWRTFDAENVAAVPTAPGAYRLYRDARVIFVGWTERGATLRSELRRHLRGDFGRVTQEATEFDYREARSRRAAYDAYLDLYLSSGLHPAEPRAGAPTRRRL